jgi:hydrogenase maturation protein HypF
MGVAAHSLRVQVRVEGTVQGVGFRPFVYRLAGELGLDGWVRNDAHGVLLEVEGPSAGVDAFLARLTLEAPPLAVIDRVRSAGCHARGIPGFRIQASAPSAGERDAPVAPDTAACDACLGELEDPADHRFGYAFINCTNCGPRFSIVTGVPYDRPLTTMAGFTMCPDCRREYSDPGDRRFHAQPNACPACGPAVTLIDLADDRHIDAGAGAVNAAAIALANGAILAVKGIGGFHLACRADDAAAVTRLRSRKHREAKPFALMACSLADAEQIVVLNAAERTQLSSPERPIVLARRRDARVAAEVAPGSTELGVMLPYSPLHHLLATAFVAQAPDALGALVLTSGNRSDEPIAFRDDDARSTLGEIAELMLTHNRPIETRTDDSVVRVVRLGERSERVFLRRSRGYVPASVPLTDAAPVPLLACGAEQKHTFCLVKRQRAWVSHHIGDLENYATLQSFTDGVGHFERLFDVHPRVVVHDLHPEYLSTKYALERDGVELIGVQHHHAHLAACLAEHGIMGPAVGAIFDGSGYGTDGTVWGGEILYGDVGSCERVGSLLPVRLPGGAQAIRQPWRMACSWLTAAAQSDTSRVTPALPVWLRDAGVATDRWSQVESLIHNGLASPLTSSMGRLFDAVAALCGLRTVVSYEGQAAIELEAACDPGERGYYSIAVSKPDGELLRLDPREAILAVLADRRGGVSTGVIAARFHGGVAAATVQACVRAAAARGADLVVLSGGVFQNRRLLEAVAAGVERAGLRVITPSRLPANDGGIAFGQAAVAARRLNDPTTGVTR